jgi:hypothetical protein
MQTYRHPHGNGLKHLPAEASPDTFLDSDSTLEGESRVYASSIQHSALRDTFTFAATIRDSVAADSRIVDAEVYQSDVRTSDVAGMGVSVEECQLTDCRVFADDGHAPQLLAVGLVGVSVYAGAILRGPWELDLPGAHIHAGTWTAPPRHVLIEGNGIHEAVVECTEGRAHLGCSCKPVSYWLKVGPRLAQKFGWTDEQKTLCRDLLLSLN